MIPPQREQKHNEPLCHVNPWHIHRRYLWPLESHLKSWNYNLHGWLDDCFIRFIFTIGVKFLLLSDNRSKAHSLLILAHVTLTLQARLSARCVALVLLRASQPRTPATSASLDSSPRARGAPGVRAVLLDPSPTKLVFTTWLTDFFIYPSLMRTSIRCISSWIAISVRVSLWTVDLFDKDTIFFNHYFDSNRVPFLKMVHQHTVSK